jgi:DNA-binding GntR family transcriptional regulator
MQNAIFYLFPTGAKPVRKEAVRQDLAVEMRVKSEKAPLIRVGKKLPPSVALHEQARNRLRTLIVRGQLPPGASIVETELSESLGISRTPLREALKLLAVEGLVDLRSNRSSQIAPLRALEIEQVFEVAAGLEGMAAAFAAERATAADIKRLRQMQARMELHHDRGERDEYFMINQEVHRFIVACAKNPILSATHDNLFARAERARFLALSSRTRWDDSVSEHRDLLQAIEAHDSLTASRILAQHVATTGHAVKQEIDRADRESAGAGKSDRIAAPEKETQSA